MSTKNCLKCQLETPLNNFYKAGSYYQAYCRSCHNQRRAGYYVKKTKTINDMSSETLLKMSADLQNGLSFVKLGKKYNKKSPTLYKWARDGKFNNSEFVYTVRIKKD